MSAVHSSIAVHSALRGVVVDITVDPPDVPVSTTGYRVLPTLGSVIGFQYRGRLSIRRRGLDEALARGGVTGFQAEARTFVPDDQTRTVLVRLTPLGGYRLLGCAMSELADRHVPMEHLVSSATDAVRRVGSAEPIEAAGLVQDWLIDALQSNGRDVHADVEAAIQRITSTHGGEPVRDLADAVGVGRRHLERLFRQQVGVGPKEFASLVRFRRVLTRMGRQRAWADVALDAGYADQAHFIRSFKRRTGLTPGEYAATCCRQATVTTA